MMKEMSFNIRNQIIELESRFDQLFDFFHSTNLKREEYFVALYLLYVYQRKIDLVVSVSNSSQNIEINLSDLNSQSLTLDSGQTKKLNDAFKPLLEKIGEHGLLIVGDILSGVDRNALKEVFPEIFDRLLYKLAKSQGRFSGEYIMPMELSRFMCSIAELSPNAKIYNPFAGLASFGIFLDGGQEYLGQEINSTTWALGALRILAHEREGVSKFVLGDSINDWNPTRTYKSNKPEDILLYSSDKEKFDLIISEPPFGMRISNHLDGMFGSIKTYEHFLIEHGLKDLNQNGKMILCFPQGLLFRSGSEQNLRHYLIENDLLEMVISLPGGLLMNTGIPVVILLINKNKKQKGKVKLVDASKFVEASKSREKKLNDYALTSSIHKSVDSDVIKIVSNETIAEFDYNLNVPRYFKKEINGVPLAELGTIIRGQRISDGHKGKFIRIRDLKDDKLDFELSLGNIEDVVLPRNVQLIEESCLLLAVRWKTLKPTYFTYTGTPVFLNSDTVAFKLNETLVNVAFIVNELHAAYVMQQLNAYRVGEAIPAIRRADLLNVKIALPSIEEQRAKITGILELSAKINQLQAERNALAHGIGKIQYNEFASLKHTLGAPRQNILSYAEALITFFENNKTVQSEQVNSDFKNETGVDLATVFHAIKHDINFISELLEKGENGLVLSDYDLEIINLQELDKFIGKTKKGSI